MLNGLDLFSGIGGISLALGPWIKPIAYCENDRYCQAVLLSRMRTGELGLAPIWDDVRTLRRENVWKKPDIIYGGFPCQDISESGNGKGLAGERSGLFFEIMRLAKEIKPEYLFLENVRNIRSRGLPMVIREISQLGYDCRWDIFPAYEDKNFFEGERWFLLAKAKSAGFPCRWLRSGNASPAARDNSAISSPIWNPNADSMAGAVDGISSRVHRIRALGNAVVPLQAREAFMRLAGLK